MGGISQDNLLRSWKEISSYLGCDVRTCHRWEDNHGMPVHRAQGAESKSPVFAYKDELDRWFQGTFKNSNPPAEKAPAGRPWLKWAAAGAIVLALAGVYLYFAGNRIRRQPADFTIDGSYLVILDKQKRELWRHDTKFEGLMPESFFRGEFQALSRDPAAAFPSLIIRDINADGDTEVLFAPKEKAETTGSGRLYCFDRKGAEIWGFDAGKELTCGEKVFSSDYRIPGFVCHDLDGDGHLETLVFAYQKLRWPCQMAVLDDSGRRLGEYWNSGQLKYPVFQDINGDGREELIVVGVNNEYKGGCLIVFDTRQISGASPQSGDYACLEYEPGSELYYVTVPLADVSTAMGFIVQGFNYAFATENGRINATYGSGLYYEFDFGLRCLQVTNGNSYEALHNELIKAGKITSVLGDEYLRELRDGVRYWNGSAMVPEPSMVRR